MFKQFFICCFILTIVSCKKDLIPVNDCSDAKSVSAAFKIEEQRSTHPLYRHFTETDGVFGNKYVRFTAEESDANYTWYIGSEIIHTKEVYRYFDTSFIGQTIPITLLVRKAPNTICLPNDDGYDSIVKYFTVYNFNDSTLMEGTFRVKSPLLSDSVDIKIDFKTYSYPYFEMADIYNYDGLGSNCIKNIERSPVTWCYNYRQIWIESATLYHLGGNAHYKINGEVELNFTIRLPEQNNYKEFKYRGRKL